jgi:hypothetical protein
MRRLLLLGVCMAVVERGGCFGLRERSGLIERFGELEVSVGG